MKYKRYAYIVTNPNGSLDENDPYVVLPIYKKEKDARVEAKRLGGGKGVDKVRIMWPIY